MVRISVLEIVALCEESLDCDCSFHLDCEDCKRRDDEAINNLYGEGKGDEGEGAAQPSSSNSRGNERKSKRSCVRENKLMMNPRRDMRLITISVKERVREKSYGTLFDWSACGRSQTLHYGACAPVILLYSLSFGKKNIENLLDQLENLGCTPSSTRIRYPHCRRFRFGKISNQRVVIVMSGLGMVNAGVATQLLGSLFRLKGVLHYGIAGNADVNLEIGDVTIPKYWAHSGLWNWQTRSGYDKVDTTTNTVVPRLDQVCNNNLMQKNEPSSTESFYTQVWGSNPILCNFLQIIGNPGFKTRRERGSS
ncbi:hypothetical protein YC2023_032284 [Brassica napus]